MNEQGFQRIVFATDGSEEAQGAQTLAASFAKASGAQVRVVHAWNLEVHHRQGAWDVEMRSEAEKLISQAVTSLRADGIDADGEVVRADSNHVAEAIEKLAREFNADLVVVGCRGLSDWQAMTQHSISHELLTKLDCPMLIVRGTTAVPVGKGRRLVVAVAGGDDIEPAIRTAIAAASVPASVVLVVHVAQSMFGAMGAAYVETDNEIQLTIDRATSMLKAAGIRSELLIAEPGPVARIVADAAQRWKADLIVIGSARMGDLGSLVFGSVTHDLLRASDRPILVAERIQA